jgi:hypothetical protein
MAPLRQRNCNHLCCVRSPIAFSCDGEVDQCTMCFYGQDVLQKMEVSFVNTQILFQHHFEIHLNEPVPSAYAILHNIHKHSEMFVS